MKIKKRHELIRRIMPSDIKSSFTVRMYSWKHQKASACTSG